MAVALAAFIGMAGVQRLSHQQNFARGRDSSGLVGFKTLSNRKTM
jgi:hypothetical protein